MEVENQNIELNLATPIEKRIEDLKKLIFKYQIQEEEGLLSERGLGRLSGFIDALRVIEDDYEIG